MTATVSISNTSNAGVFSETIKAPSLDVFITSYKLLQSALLSATHTDELVDRVIKEAYYIIGTRGNPLEASFLTAKLCQKPNLLSSRLEELIGEVDIDVKKPVTSKGSIPNWQSSSVLSEEEVNLVMYHIYSCYQIASKQISDATGATMLV
ncbi:hypothetical protein BC332_11192 [Capsicum chinense]|nr:hypothetical protein BC332_11192 [Capsicum chinense]